MIHLYKSNGYNIAVDANSASVHSLDEVAFEAALILDSMIDDESRAAEILSSETVLVKATDKLLMCCNSCNSTDSSISAHYETKTVDVTGSCCDSKDPICETDTRCDSKGSTCETDTRCDSKGPICETDTRCDSKVPTGETESCCDSKGPTCETDSCCVITREEAAEVIGDLAELCKEGLLWSSDIYEDTASELKVKQSVLKAICLHVAHGCNMDCEYCFAGKGDYSGKSGIMSLETGKRALDYLVENSGSRRHLEVDFFGGEPLLNWDVCKELVRYGRELEKKYDKIFNFTLTTNGVLIDDDVIDFTNREMGNVVLSMDGRQSTHDRMRHTKTGDGTYDRIMDNFKALVKSRTGEGEKLGSEVHTGSAARRSKEYYMRGTYTAYNKDFCSDVLAMADLGFRETSIEPVVSDPSAPYALCEDDLPQLFEEYDRLAMEMLEREKRGEGFNFYHYTVDLTGGPCIYKRVSGCGVATEYLAVTPSGDLYPCHQFVGDDEMIVGNIYDGITHPETVDIFRGNNNLYTRDKCRGCWAKLYCAGGCAANNFHSNGDINKVYEFGCKLHRKRIECALMLAVARAEEADSNN